MEKEQLVSLVTKAQQGDNEALNCLFNEFYNDLYYFALKTVKDDETALDVTQEAFVEIINTLGNLKEPAAFVTWAKQITYHQCTRYFKKKKEEKTPVVESPKSEEKEDVVGDINPYTRKEYKTNSVRMHPKRIGYVQVYDQEQHKWTDMTEWAFLGYQERKKALLGKDYVPPTYLD